MKTSPAVFVLISFSVVIAFAEAPSPPKLPHVPSGKTTPLGLDLPVPLPKEGLVPDKETAIKVAEVILFRLYGEKNITVQKPYSVTEDQNIWRVCERRLRPSARPSRLLFRGRPRQSSIYNTDAIPDA